MPIDDALKQELKNRIKDILKLEKRIDDQRLAMLEGYTSPFLKCLLGNRTTLTVKIVQSLQTTLGMSFYEQACEILGKQFGYKVETQKKIKGELCQEVNQYLTKLDRIDYEPDRKKELDDIRAISKNIFPTGSQNPTYFVDSTVDVLVTTPNGNEFLIDITTVKLNKKGFRTLKNKMLRWAAYRMSQNPDVIVEPYFAIPYNPEAEDITGTDYNRFKQYYDRLDLLVGDELWRKVSGDTCSIKDIADIFEELGEEMSHIIDGYFSNL